MEKVKIQIKRLGAIRDSEIELSPLMIFTGESGLGKSYLAILCHYLFELLTSPTRLNRFFQQNERNFNILRGGLKDSGVAIELMIEDILRWIDQDAVSYMRELVGNENLDVDVVFDFPLPIDQDGVLKIDYREDISGLVEHEDVYLVLSLSEISYRVRNGNLSEDVESPFSILLRYAMIERLMGDYRALRGGTFILPPSRGMVVSELVGPRTGLYKRFCNEYRFYSSFNPHRSEENAEILKLLEVVLNGSISDDANELYYTTEDGARMPISASASSIRELAPLERFIRNSSDVSRSAILFEEPEAHLHPQKQRAMGDLIAAMSNRGTYMQITTHSDYLLTRLIELIRFENRLTEDGFEQWANENDLLLESVGFDYKERLSVFLLRRRGDLSVEIKSLEIDDSIPFDTFLQPVEDAMRVSLRLDDFDNREEADLGNGKWEDEE